MAASALAVADSILRVMPRTLQPSLSIRRATEPPSPPVAPQTTMSLVIASSVLAVLIYDCDFFCYVA